MTPIKDELYLFRDRLGVKPSILLLAKTNNLYFSSEVSPILDLADQASYSEITTRYYGFFNLGSVINPLTFYEEIKLLPPACFIKYSDNNLILKKYHTISYKPNTYSYTENVIKTRKF